ncbi:hypothetical protein [Roseicyclus elongatus]|uniref:hypothetical protein n=1 Tax=Roseicyclus elongatus TaxID=159346 RepID=UPI0012EBE484|nr:hypothetical protein [Roseibacterium elongatum]
MNNDAQKKLIEKWSKLVDKLVDQTRSGSLQWAESAKSNEYILNVGDNNIKLGSAQNRDEQVLYYVRIENGFGEVVEQFDDEDLDGVMAKPYPENYFGKLEDLHSKVRRQVTGADEILDEILEWLQENEPIPF